jgi:ribosome modulation factor
MSSLEPRPSVVGAAAAMSDSGASEKPTSVDEGMLSPGLAAVLEAASQRGWAAGKIGSSSELQVGVAGTARDVCGPDASERSALGDEGPINSTRASATA